MNVRSSMLCTALGSSRSNLNLAAVNRHCNVAWLRLLGLLCLGCNPLTRQLVFGAQTPVRLLVAAAAAAAATAAIPVPSLVTALHHQLQPHLVHVRADDGIVLVQLQRTPRSPFPFVHIRARHLQDVCEPLIGHARITLVLHPIVLDVTTGAASPVCRAQLK
jgi:hypothetical protein